MRTKTLTITTLAIGLLAAACGGGPASGSGASIVDDEPEVEATDTADDELVDETGTDDTGDGEVVDDADAGEAEESAEDEAAEKEPAEAALGTRDNPLPVGTRIEMGDWTLAVTEVTPDATEQIMAENEFNDPPVEGRQFLLFTVDAAYGGEESGTAWLDFSWAIVGSAGNTFGTAMDDYCGVIPNSLDDTGETYPGGSVSGNVCVSVDAEQVEGATIRIEESLSFADTRAFYALD